VEAIRYAARRAVEASALRPVAAEMGMAPSWLNAFVEGKETALRSQTRKKLLDWYVRVAPGLAEQDAATAAAALALLTGGLMEESERRAARSRLVQALARSYADAGPLPAWVRELLDDETT
jgi:protein-disulfide isomerase-like protein with CxxC motif